jgi:hypothetical protein
MGQGYSRLSFGMGLCSKTSTERNCAATLAAALVLVVLFMLGSAGAQSTVGTIVGTVTDQSGAVLVGVKVTVTNTDTGIARTVNTDETGNYQVPRLLPGRYSVTAELSGFKKAAVIGIILQVNQEARYDIRMEVGEVTQEVSVSAEGTVQVQTEDATLGQVVDHKKVVELPLNGRNFMQLVTIGSGAAPITNSQGGAIEGETQRAGLSYTISGQREVSMSYLIDGVESRSEFEQMSGLQASLDSIQEFKLQRNAFSAEFGSASAIINVAIKSGTNDFHGSLFEFLRNDVLDSSQFQDPVVDGQKQKAPFRMNQFGGSIGGPVWIPKVYDGKNRTFWFFGYEGLRRRRFEQFPSVAIPTRFRGGDFSDFKDANGNLIPIYDPLTQNPVTGQRQQFPGNIIPSDRIDPLTKQLLAYYPAPQNEFAPPGVINGIYASGTTRNDDQYHVRIDHKISDKTSIFGRYSWFKSPIISPLGYGDASRVNYLLDDRNIAVSLTHTFSARSINEFRFGYNKDDFNVIPDWSGGNVTEQLGIKNLNPVPQQYGLPATGGVNFSGVGPYGWDIVSGGKLYTFNDVLTLIRGAHTFKVGGEIRRMAPWQLAEDTGRRGVFTFTGDFTAQVQKGASVAGTGSDIADFLLGTYQNTEGGIGSTYTEFDWTDLHGFVQDDWKIASNFVLSLGLRYEFHEQPVPRDGKLESWCPDCFINGFRGDLLLTDKPNASGRIGPAGAVYNDYNNFAPRLGFAWTPFSGHKDTVLRGGFGVFYENTKGDEVNFRQFHPDKTQLFNPPIDTSTVPTLFMKDAYPLPPPGFNADPFTVDANDRWPYILQWNMNVQHKLPGNMILEVGYVGSHGNKLSKRWNINQAVLDKDPLNPTPISSRVPYPLFGTVLGSFKAGISNYNALQVRLEKNFQHGFYFVSGYTYSRCQDMDSSASFAADNQNIYDFKGDYGLCGFQIKNRFNWSGGWEIPVGNNLKGVSGVLVKGWQVNSIVQLQDGSPFTPRVSGDPARVGARYYARPDRLCDGNLSGSEQTVTRFFDTSCFVPSEPGTFGDSGRNVLIGPGFKSVDFSVFKNFQVTERVRIQFRTELFNAFNFSNYNGPGVSVSSPATFGVITTEKDAREIQFGLRITF